MVCLKALIFKLVKQKYSGQFIVHSKDIKAEQFKEEEVVLHITDLNLMELVVQEEY